MTLLHPHILTEDLLSRYTARYKGRPDLLLDEFLAQGVGEYVGFKRAEAGLGEMDPVRRELFAGNRTRRLFKMIPSGLLPAIQELTGPDLPEALPSYDDALPELKARVKGRTFKQRRFAGGGLVPGVGNTDSVPALLEPGGYVVRKAAVEAVGPHALASLAGHGPRLAKGGLVPALTMPGEWIFDSEQARRIGRPTLDRLNRTGQLPRFAAGGNVPGVYQLSYLLDGAPGTWGTNAASEADARAQLARLLPNAVVQAANLVRPSGPPRPPAPTPTIPPLPPIPPPRPPRHSSTFDDPLAVKAAALSAFRDEDRLSNRESGVLLDHLKRVLPGGSFESVAAQARQSGYEAPTEVSAAIERRVRLQAAADARHRQTLRGGPALAEDLESRENAVAMTEFQRRYPPRYRPYIDQGLGPVEADQAFVRAKFASKGLSTEELGGVHGMGMFSARALERIAREGGPDLLSNKTRLGIHLEENKKGEQELVDAIERQVRALRPAIKATEARQKAEELAARTISEGANVLRNQKGQVVGLQDLGEQLALEGRPIGGVSARTATWAKVKAAARSPFGSLGRGLGRVGRSFTEGTGGLLAMTAAPLLAEQFGPDADEAERVVASGQGAESYRNKAVAAGTLQGMAQGAAAGSLFGPIGLAAGAAVGGLMAFSSAVAEAASALRAAQITADTSNLEGKLDSLGKGGSAMDARESARLTASVRALSNSRSG